MLSFEDILGFQWWGFHLSLDIFFYVSTKWKLKLVVCVNAVLISFSKFSIIFSFFKLEYPFLKVYIGYERKNNKSSLEPPIVL